MFPAYQTNESYKMSLSCRMEVACSRFYQAGSFVISIRRDSSIACFFPSAGTGGSQSPYEHERYQMTFSPTEILLVLWYVEGAEMYCSRGWTERISRFTNLFSMEFQWHFGICLSFWYRIVHRISGLWVDFVVPYPLDSCPSMCAFDGCAVSTPEPANTKYLLSGTESCFVSVDGPTPPFLLL